MGGGIVRDKQKRESYKESLMGFWVGEGILVDKFGRSYRKVYQIKVKKIQQTLWLTKQEMVRCLQV